MDDERVLWNEHRGLPSFARYQLDPQHDVFQGWLPTSHTPPPKAFEAMWSLHPPAPDGAAWKASYGRLRPTPAPFAPLARWVVETLDHRLQTVFVRWYDAAFRHARPPRRAHRIGVQPRTPFVLISLGAPRTLRLRPVEGRGYRDFWARSGTIFVFPASTHMAWTYEVPHQARDRGRRIALGFQAMD